MRRFAPGVALLTAFLCTRTAAAHSGEPLAPHDLWAAWAFEPGPVLLIVTLALVYACAAANLWTAAGAGRGLSHWRAGVFAGGLALLWLALLSPLDALAGVLFSAHMAQHVLLMMAAAPLLALGALITFAHTPWYPSYTATTADWGLTPLADQQLSGVIMWIPTGLVYLGAMLALIGTRLRQWDQPRRIEGELP